jgi:hypothetical protein
MEVACKECSSIKKNSQDNVESNEIICCPFSTNYIATPGYSRKNSGYGLKLSAKFQRVIQDNEGFKQDIRAELDDLRKELHTKLSPSPSLSCLTGGTGSFGSGSFLVATYSNATSVTTDV